MYQRIDGGLGLSFAVPDWLKATGTAIIKGVSLTIPTPMGPVQLTPEQIAAAARGAKVGYTPPRAGSESPGAFVERNVPGGWGTVALVGGGLLAVMFLMRGRR